MARRLDTLKCVEDVRKEGLGGRKGRKKQISVHMKRKEEREVSFIGEEERQKRSKGDTQGCRQVRSPIEAGRKERKKQETAWKKSRNPSKTGVNSTGSSLPKHHSSSDTGRDTSRTKRSGRNLTSPLSAPESNGSRWKELHFLVSR
jgi:hypothetical protein